MDPLADETKANQVAKELNLPKTVVKRLRSEELGGRNVTLHYPALLAYKDHALCNQVQRGYRTSETYEKIVNQMMEACP